MSDSFEWARWKSEKRNAHSETGTVEHDLFLARRHRPGVEV